MVVVIRTGMLYYQTTTELGLTKAHCDRTKIFSQGTHSNGGDSTHAAIEKRIKIRNLDLPSCFAGQAA